MLVVLKLLLHVKITLKALKNPDAQASPQTAFIGISGGWDTHLERGQPFRMGL